MDSAIQRLNNRGELFLDFEDARAHKGRKGEADSFPFTCSPRAHKWTRKKKRRFLRGVAHVTASIYGTYFKGT